MVKQIENVLICGLGAIGCIYADRLNNIPNVNLKILLDDNRLKKYQNSKIFFNDKELNVDYVTPDNTDFSADLIIIAVKYHGLFEIIKQIKNFVTEDTVIISLLNGISSEQLIADIYGWSKVLYSFYVGDSAIREGFEVKHNGRNKIVFGSENPNNKNIERLKIFFDSVGIRYEIPSDIIHALWLKFILNISWNQPSAILGMDFGGMKNSKHYRELMINVMTEAISIAKAEGVNNTESFLEEGLLAFDNMAAYGKTSMLQDIEAGRKTEVDMFAGEIIKLGEKHNIPTPYNTVFLQLIEILQEKNMN